MTQLNQEHFETIDRNKAERYERQKLTRIEDRLNTLEKSVARLNEKVANVNIIETIVKEHIGDKE